MNRFSTALTLVITLASAGWSGAHGSDARIDETLARHMQVMEVTAEGIQGPGAEMLVEMGRAAAFFALGESHLNKETPALTAGLLAELAPAGYSAFAIETGPMIADHAEDLLRAGRADELGRLVAEIPFTAAFIDHVPEFELLAHAVELKYELWGLDQVFAGGARFNLARLVELASDHEARSLAEQSLARARTGFMEFAQSGDSSAGFLQSTGSTQYRALRTAFAGNEEAVRIIDELENSSRIYQLYGQGANYQSNRERIDLMKRHLAERIRDADPATRVFLKFGSVHMRRGYSPLNQLDLGNAAAELGVFRGGGSIHVNVGALSSVNGDGQVRDWTADSAVLGRLARAMPENAQWAVFDLRPLRPVLHAEVVADAHPELAELVWGYDVMVLARQFTAAHRLPGVPAPPGS